MTRIYREQFRNEFQSGIDINSMSDQTKAELEKVGITKKKLAEIAHNDGKISGTELDKLFNTIDKFENKRVDGYIDTYVNGFENELGPRGGHIEGVEEPSPTKGGKAYEALKSEFEQNRKAAQMTGLGPAGGHLEGTNEPRQKRNSAEHNVTTNPATNNKQSSLEVDGEVWAPEFLENGRLPNAMNSPVFYEGIILKLRKEWSNKDLPELDRILPHDSLVIKNMLENSNIPVDLKGKIAAVAFMRGHHTGYLDSKVQNEMVANLQKSWANKEASEIDKSLTPEPYQIGRMLQYQLPVDLKAKVLSVALLRGGSAPSGMEMPLDPVKIRYQQMAMDTVLKAKDKGELFEALSSNDGGEHLPTHRRPATQLMHIMLQDGGWKGNYNGQNEVQKWIEGLPSNIAGRAMYHMYDAAKSKDFGGSFKITGIGVELADVGFSFQGEYVDTHWAEVTQNISDGAGDVFGSRSPEERQLIYEGFLAANKSFDTVVVDDKPSL